IQRVDFFGDLRGGARRDLRDGGDGTCRVARVDPLWAVAAVEVFVEAQARGVFQHRDAHFLGDSWVDGGLVDDDVALAQDATDAGAGLEQRVEIRLPGGIDRRRHGDDVHRRIGDI